MRQSGKNFHRILFTGILFLAFFSGCGNGVNISSEGINDASLTTEMKPSKSTTTDSAGQARFIASQGQYLIFEIRDSDTHKPLSAITITFTEAQNGSFSINIEDPSGNYSFTNFVGSLPKADTSKKTEASLFKLGLERI